MTLNVGADHGQATATTKQNELDLIKKEIEGIELKLTHLSINEAKKAREQDFDKEIIEARDKMRSVLQNFASAVRAALHIESKPMSKEDLEAVEAGIQDNKIELFNQMEELQVKKKEILATFFRNEPRVVFLTPAEKANSGQIQPSPSVTKLSQLLLLGGLLPESLKEILAQDLGEDIKIAEFVKQVNYKYDTERQLNDKVTHLSLNLSALSATAQDLGAEKAIHKTTRRALVASRERVKLMTPLFNVGVTVRKGDLELGKRIRYNGTFIELRGGPPDKSLIDARNNAAHGGNALADYSMIGLSALTQNQQEIVLLRYREKISRAQFLKGYMLSTIPCENWRSVLDMRGTMFSCYVGTKYVTHDKGREEKFNKLDKEIEETLEKYINESTAPVALHDALKKLDEDRAVGVKVKAMKEIAEVFAKEERKRYNDS